MKKNKGITLIPLIMLIVIMLILLGITTKVSRNILEKSKTEKLVAYMQLIDARANAYYEEMDFNIGEKSLEGHLMNNTQEILIKVNPELEKMDIAIAIDDLEESCVFIKWDNNMLRTQGIEDTFLKKDDEYFIVVYNYLEHKVENIYYNKGIYVNERKDENGNKKLIYNMRDLKKEVNR